MVSTTFLRLVIPGLFHLKLMMGRIFSKVIAGCMLVVR